MPQEKIIIKFEPKGDKELMRAINLLTAAQKGLEKGSRAYKKELKRLGLQQTKYNSGVAGGVRNNRIFANSFATMRSALLLFQFAMGMGIKQLMDFTALAGKLEGLQNGFQELTKSTEFTTDTLERLRKATNNTASDMDLLKQANNALILGVAKNSFEMEEMFDIAQRLGRALGVDTTMAVESLVTGLGRQSRLMLDNIGIIVKSEQAYDEFAARLGTTADKLTNTQKKTAFLEAGLEAAREKVKGLGDEVLTTGDRLATLGAMVENIKIIVGQTLSPLIGDAAAFYGQWADKIKAADDKQVEQSGHIVILQKELVSLMNLQHALFEQMNDSAKIQRLATREAISYEEAQRLAEERMALVSRQVNSLNSEIEKQTILYTGLVKVLEKVSEVNHKMGNNDLPIQRDAVQDLTDKYTGMIEKQEESTQINVDYSSDLNKIHAGFLENREAMDMTIQGFSAITSAMSANVNARMKNEMDALKATSKYQRADGDKRKAMEKGVTDSYANERTRLAKFEKASNLAQAGINIATAITKVLPNVILASLVAAMGAVQIGAILGTPIPKFATGGMIGGRRHSQGGTMINAEAGEFVMSRSAVQSVGIENLNRMNEGGGGSAVTVNVSGNVLSQDFVEGELAENIKEAIRRGTDFGIS